MLLISSNGWALEQGDLANRETFLEGSHKKALGRRRREALEPKEGPCFFTDP